MVKGSRHKYSFPAEGGYGWRGQIEVWVDIVDMATLEDPTSEIEGMFHLKTSEGDEVERLEKGKYLNQVTGENLTSSDKTAP